MQPQERPVLGGNEAGSMYPSLECGSHSSLPQFPVYALRYRAGCHPGQARQTVRLVDTRQRIELEQAHPA